MLFHAPVDAAPNELWPDTEGNVFDTPETVRRLLIHNERIKALCPQK